MNTHAHRESMENVLFYITSGEGKPYRRIEKINSVFLVTHLSVCAHICTVKEGGTGKKTL